MNSKQRAEIEELVNNSLNKAEAVWEKVGKELVEKRAEFSALHGKEALSVPTEIPGYPFIEDGEPIVDEFIALVLDMRDSSKHLNVAIADAGASQLQRVYYETTAILPACARIIKNNEGGITEYLGDGLLAFFRVNKEKSETACYASRHAAIDCMIAVSEIINPILNKRYNLPAIEIGIGLAVSRAVLTLTGDPSSLRPTAFGKCVFYATKLSKERKKIIVDESLEFMWPTSKDGKVRFDRCSVGGLTGFVMYTAE